jgi:uracil-DNA glycosylase family 4
MDGEHPIVTLRRLLAEQFTDDLPAGVHPVGAWCRDPQFFPGATGLLRAKSWTEVDPGSDGIAGPPPAAPLRGVLVLGNYQATLASYQRVLDGTIGGFPRTWGVLRRLLAAIPPTEVFLTNAYIGLPDLPNDQDPFPTNPAFTARCGRLLRREIELFQPRTVVCLGTFAATMLATITPQLHRWRPWTSYSDLRARNAEIVSGCQVDDTRFTAIAVGHPSARLSNVERQRQADLISAAADAGITSAEPSGERG